MFCQSSLLISSDDWGAWPLFTHIKKGGRHPFGMALLLPEKFRWELVVRGNKFWDLDFFWSLTLRSLCTFLFDLNRFKPSECLRAIEHYKNFAPAFSLITSSLSILNGRYRASRMGANKLNLNLDRAKRVKKLMSEANSELLLLFIKVIQGLTKNCPDESSESEIQ